MDSRPHEALSRYPGQTGVGKPIMVPPTQATHYQETLTACSGLLEEDMASPKQVLGLWQSLLAFVPKGQKLILPGRNL